MFEYMENVSDLFDHNNRVDAINALARDGWRVIACLSESRRVVVILEKEKVQV